MDLPESFAAACCQVLKERRHRLGLSQEDVAKRAGLARSYVCDVERGARHPALKNVHVLAQALELPTSGLIAEVEMNLASQIDLQAFRGSINVSSLHTDILEYFNNRLSTGLVIADEKGFLFFNSAANRISGLGYMDIPPDRWSEVYGCFKADRVTRYDTQELPLVRAIAGESSDGSQLFIRNEKSPQGRFLSITGRPLKRSSSSEAKAGIILIREVATAS